MFVNLPNLEQGRRMAEAIYYQGERAEEPTRTLEPALRCTPRVRAWEPKVGEKQTELAKGKISSGDLPGLTQKTWQHGGWRGEWIQEREGRQKCGVWTNKETKDGRLRIWGSRNHGFSHWSLAILCKFFGKFMRISSFEWLLSLCLLASPRGQIPTLGSPFLWQGDLVGRIRMEQLWRFRDIAETSCYSGEMTLAREHGGVDVITN